MAYTNNQFCWHGLISTDTDKAKAFYSEVMGWTLNEVQMGEDTATFFVNNDIPRAHLMDPPMAGVPSHWNNYLRVDDVDARTQACADAGGNIIKPADDIPPGRFSVVQTPSGAIVSLFHEADETTAKNAPRDDGGVAWVELWSKDIQTDLAFLNKALGLTWSEMDMPNGKYFLLENNGESIHAGAMQSQDPNTPACFALWFAVENVDETVTRSSNNGGNTIAPAFDVPGVGRLAILQDPAGGVFGVIKSAEG